MLMPDWQPPDGFETGQPAPKLASQLRNRSAGVKAGYSFTGQIHMFMYTAQNFTSWPFTFCHFIHIEDRNNMVSFTNSVTNSLNHRCIHVCWPLEGGQYQLVSAQPVSKSTNKLPSYYQWVSKLSTLSQLVSGLSPYPS